MNFLELKTLARQRADMESSDFVGEPEIGTYVNLAAKKLYNLLVSQFEDYFIKDPAPTYDVTDDDGSIELPSDFYKLKGLDWLNDGSTRYVPAKPFDFESSRDLIGHGGVAGTYKLWYIPQFTELQNDTDRLTGMLQFEGFVVVDAAILCLEKEESDVSFLMAERQKIEQEIKELASNRDVAEPMKVRNVRTRRTRSAPRYHILGNKVILVGPTRTNSDRWVDE